MKRILIPVMALLLAAVLLLSGCGAHGVTLIEAGDNELSVNLFRFYLSRAKGSLAYQGEAVGLESYWSTWVNDTQTRAEFYNAQVFEAFRLYAAALMLYDDLGLSLSDADEAQIDADVQSLIDYHANGSETELDAILSAYGANTTVLRDSYILETKLKQLKEYLYGTNGALISAEHKESFYQEKYSRVKQIWLADSYYAYELDECGNPVYYLLNSDGSLGEIAYDTVKGVAEQTPDGKTVYRKFGIISYDKTSEGVFKSDERDDEGYLIYYTDEQKTAIAYDTIDGTPSTVVNEQGETVPELDAKGNQVYRKWVYAYQTDPEKVSVKYTLNDGKYVEKDYSPEEMARRLWIAGKIYDACMEYEDYDDREAAFLTYAEMYSDSAMDNGMYFMEGTSSAYSDVPTVQSIAEAIEKVEVGNLHVLKSDTGYHVLMRCELDTGAWGNEGNSKWFDTSRHSMVYYLIEHMLELQLRNGGYLERLVINEQAKISASITGVSANYRY